MEGVEAEPADESFCFFVTEDNLIREFLQDSDF